MSEQQSSSGTPSAFADIPRLLAAAPHRTFMEAHGFGLTRFMADPMPVVDGCVTAPDRPGHGVDLDFEALARRAAH